MAGPMSPKSNRLCPFWALMEMHSLADPTRMSSSPEPSQASASGLADLENLHVGQRLRSALRLTNR